MHSDYLYILHANIFDLLGINTLQRDEQEKILRELTAVLEEKISLAMFEQIPDIRKKEISEKLRSKEISGEEKFAIIHNCIPDFISFLEKEIFLFKKKLAESVRV